MTDQLKLYNSLTKQKDIFDLPKDSVIKWYICGPTVYDNAHLGHARTYLTFDIIRKVLRYLGYSVLYTMNITDIDDKIINKVDEEYKEITFENIKKFTTKMENNFWSDMDILEIERPTVVTRVSNYIDKMKNYIDKIIDNKLAYESNGSIYFDSHEFIKRGNNFTPLKNSNINDYTENSYISEKKNKEDFALWKKSRENEVGFEYMNKLGRPGWHLECSVMATDILGNNFDIHAGGIDLIFPHHNNEMIQAHAHQNADNTFRWVKFFLHCGHLNIHGLKMSKSLKNFITIKDFLQTYSSRQLRLLFLLHKWDKTLDYSKNIMDNTIVIEKRIDDFIKHIDFIKKSSKQKIYYNEDDKIYHNYIIKLKTECHMYLLDNINTNEMIKLLMEAINKTYVYLDKEYNINLVYEFSNYLVNIFNIFGVNFNNKTTIEIDKFIDVTVNLREDIRKTLIKYKKTFDKETIKEFYNILDDFRDNKLRNLNIKLEDKNKITKWNFI